MEIISILRKSWKNANNNKNTVYCLTRFTYLLLTLTPCVLTFACFLCLSLLSIYVSTYFFSHLFDSSLHTSLLFTAEYFSVYFLRIRKFFLQNCSTVIPMPGKFTSYNTFTTVKCYISLSSVDPVISFIAVFSSST